MIIKGGLSFFIENTSSKNITISFRYKDQTQGILTIASGLKDLYLWFDEGEFPIFFDKENGILKIIGVDEI